MPVDWELTEHGLARASFIPPPQIREIRELTRYRRSVVEERSREAQRLDKVLQDAGVKLSSVASDILGVSGRSMLDGAGLGHRGSGRVGRSGQRAVAQEAAPAPFGPRGPFRAHPCDLVAEITGKLDYSDEAIGRLSDVIDERIALADARERLCTIPGVDRRIAEAIIGEIGVDMTKFATPGHLASWAGMCPGQHESAGKSKKGTARKDDSWLQRHLAVAAMAAARTKAPTWPPNATAWQLEGARCVPARPSVTRFSWPSGTSSRIPRRRLSTSGPIGSIVAIRPNSVLVASSQNYELWAAW